MCDEDDEIVNFPNDDAGELGKDYRRRKAYERKWKKRKRW